MQETGRASLDFSIALNAGKGRVSIEGIFYMYMLWNISWVGYDRVRLMSCNQARELVGRRRIAEYRCGC